MREIAGTLGADRAAAKTECVPMRMYTESRGWHPACFPLSMALPVSMGTWKREREIDSVLGETVGVGVECRLRDSSGVRGSQMIKKG